MQIRQLRQVQITVQIAVQSTSVTAGVIPKTLVMNGDLTQFFHLSERQKYESIYHNIIGLEQYFPSLGNHDYKHGSTSTYNLDDWLGQRSCNAEHALGYFRGAFCGGIPNFDPGRRVTAYDPHSLSYSWDEVVNVTDGMMEQVQVHLLRGGITLFRCIITHSTKMLGWASLHLYSGSKMI